MLIVFSGAPTAVERDDAPAAAATTSAASASASILLILVLPWIQRGSIGLTGIQVESKDRRRALRSRQGGGLGVDAQLVVEHHAVVALGRLARDEGVDHVRARALGVALERAGKAAADQIR